MGSDWDQRQLCPDGGCVGVISQSGNLVLELALLAKDYELGFSRFASLVGACN